ncbi:MAG TPA: hypothetical protein VHL60_07555 [Oxalicibacterium sp.]|jgi:hypothetical protein|nr:hypothetical protein [Oxalicibacterium sp.]
MSNIAGKAYAMNVITPIRWYMTWINKLIFWIALKTPSTLKGLMTLSLIHYARWVIIGRKQFPHLDKHQPKEDLHYAYMLFFSNFNGSWAQYVDSFTFAIPAGLDLFWKWNVRYPKSVPLTSFHSYIQFNQIQTDHYYNAYPMATANDIKSARKLKAALVDFDTRYAAAKPEEFQKQYNKLLRELQHDLGTMQPLPIVSLADQAKGD